MTGFTALYRKRQGRQRSWTDIDGRRRPAPWQLEMKEQKVAGYTSNGMAGFTEHGPDEGFDLAMGTVRGYRWWKWEIPARLVGYMAAPPTPDFGTLIGAYGGAWEDGKIEAQCPRGVPTWADLIEGNAAGHQVPEYRTTCGCGFWAYWPPDSPNAVTGGAAGSSSRGPVAIGANQDKIIIPVFGSVTGSGRVILGEKGFRSQYAKIESLCLPEEAVNLISWWDGGSDAPGKDDKIRRSAAYNALMQGGGYYAPTPMGSSSWTVNPSKSYQRKTDRADSTEVVARAAILEAALEANYPSARIMTSQRLLTKVFPPDSNYYRPEPPHRYPQWLPISYIAPGRAARSRWPGPTSGSGTG